jgi:hypothetical protein
VSRRRVLAGGIGSLSLLGVGRFGRAGEALTPGFSGPLQDTRSAGILVWDVEGLDYVAQEYFLAGRADVYSPVTMADAVDMTTRNSERDFGVRDFHREVLSADQPFATRVIVYKPRSARHCSGNVVVETLHPNGGGTGVVWNALHRFFAANRDVYVGVQHPVTIAGLKAADPTSYGSLSMVDPTQLWGMLTQTGAALKEGGRSSPLEGYAVKRLLMTGFSFTGVATATYANYHHEAATLSDGRPVFDAYLPMGDAQYVRPLNVPVMRLNTQSDFNGAGGLGNRRPSDDHYRHYEIAGASHVAVPPPPDAAKPPSPSQAHTPAGQPTFSAATCQASFPAGSHPNDFPLYLVQEALFDNMYRWLESGVVPPPSSYMSTNADGSVQTDGFGNAMGGVRYPQVSVPLARYGVGSTRACVLFGYTVPFEAALCRSLYGSREKYMAKVRSAARELVGQRLLRPGRVDELVSRALTSASF